MNILKTLYAADRKKWREWLEKNHDTQKETNKSGLEE
jgi:hypothetical protein